MAARRMAGSALALALAWAAATVACGGGSHPGGPGSVGGQDELQVLDQRLDGMPWLAESARRARAAGAGLLRPLGASIGAEGDRLGAFVQVPIQHCLAAVAQASEGITDTDLFAFSDGGDLLASDESTAAHAAVLVCPPHPTRIYVVARVMAGRGVVAVGAAEVAETAASAVGQALGAAGHGAVEEGRLSAWPGLETKVRERRRQLGAGWTDLRRALLPVEPRAVSTLSVPLSAGRCVDVLAVPGERVHTLDLWATDAKGRVIGRGQPPGRDRSLVVCAAHRGTLTLYVRPRIATGTVAIVVSRSAPGAASQLLARPSVVAANPLGSLAQTRARHRARTSGLKLSGPVQVATLTAQVGAADPLPIRFARGCSRIDALGGTPLAAAHAELWTADGRLIAQDIGIEAATLFRCGPAGAASLEVRAEQSAGPVAVELSVDPAPPALLLRHPGAAGRLLSLLEAVAGPVAPSSAAQVKALTVAADRRQPVAVSIPARGCMDVLAAVDEAARGVALRYVDPVTGRGAQSRGDVATAARICAAEPGTTAIDVTVDQGGGQALVLVVPVPGAGS